MKALELFAGAGGLLLGAESAGFDHVAVVEWNDSACRTLRHNLGGKRVVQTDVRLVNYREMASDLDLVAGGPPCQPFSIGGKHKGHQDHRDMFPEAVRAVSETWPKAFLFENVRGLMRKAFAPYLGYIALQLTYPSMAARSDEDWVRHLQRLQNHHTRTEGKRPEYKVMPPHVLNAVDYGVPQNRQRVFFVGFRSDLDVDWAFPRPTHSEGSLYRAKWVTGHYWEARGISPTEARPARAPAGVPASAHAASLFDDDLLPWVTLRDAIGDLPDPGLPSAEAIPNHRLQPGARPYRGHSGSPLDQPSKTLKAGDHGVPGGENMIAFPDGSFRYLTVREAARVQTFPDSYVFQGCWTEAMRQIGNAVPVTLAATMAASVRKALEKRQPKAKVS
jgi:DNA (cytosine-5)-methyltransferase 1